MGKLDTERDAQVRLSCRVSRHIKHRAEEAAAVLGQSITGFTESALAEKADAVLSAREHILLSERDFERFIAAIDNAPSPTERLVGAMREFEVQRAREPNGNW